MTRALEWQVGQFLLRMERPLVMGIVNATPDSFSDGGRSEHATLAHVDRLIDEGADLLDIGGESTRPGATPPSEDDEIARVLPVVRHAVRHARIPISVDTSRANVMRAAIDAGADIINDVRALQLPGALQTVSAHRHVGVCLMHMQGDPTTMQSQPTYASGDVVTEVCEVLRRHLTAASNAGIAWERLAVDPGIGFGKRADHQWALLRGQGQLLGLQRPLVVGWSRKSVLGLATGRPVGERGPASLAAALLSTLGGAHVLRVHDVAATRDVLAVLRASAWESDPVA